MNEKEKDILDFAFFHLKQELGSKLKRKEPPVQSIAPGYDAIFTIAGKKIYVEAKNEVRPNHVFALLDLKESHKEVLIAANYITPNAKKMLREKELNYIDRVGNTYFRLDPIYIYVESHHNQPPSEDRKNRAFTKTGIKLVFHILHTPNLLNTSYRNIVSHTGVALGTVPKVIAGLKEEGYLVKKIKKEWVIKAYDELLNRWQHEYTKKLKPGLFVKRYRSIAPDFNTNWRKMPLQSGAQWGGEAAGDLLTNYLKAEVLTLYTNQSQQDLIKQYKWIPDQSGSIFVYKQFWNPELEPHSPKYVPALLIYADLIETGSSRCMETATMIYEQYLQKY
ncbi:MAG: type IV toxin-antitoxin system AbiEi family antitoxin [Bacteroidia bacterium]|nr:type IV toxin-antitoxin system AbiEi family antitoxin [Bacteroidia bacterium]